MVSKQKRRLQDC